MIRNIYILLLLSLSFGQVGFTEHIITTSASDANSVYAADMDGDGDIDVLSASSEDGKVAWYENDGSESFTEHIIITSTSDANSVYAADMDGDGDMDVLSAHILRISWSENDGSGNFDSEHIITNYGAHSIYAVDIDNDGDIDVLRTRYGDTIAWHENDGSGSFGNLNVIDYECNYPLSVYAEDLDGDGDIDVLSASRYAYDTPNSEPADFGKIYWYDNEGGENFTKNVITENIIEPHDVFAADIDGDGDIDVLSASAVDDKISWYNNDGLLDPNFYEHEISISADYAKSVYAADIDGDGDMDVLSASSEDGKVAWYENSLLVCGDGFCNGGETHETCPADCNAPVDCDTGYILDCTDNDCCPESWIGDGFADCEDQDWGCDLSCYNNDGGDCSYDCNNCEFDFTAYGSECCDAAWEEYGIDCFTLESSYNWDCSGCNCPGDLPGFFGHWREHIITTSANFANDVYATDIDGDGDIDVLSASSEDGKVLAWYENDCGYSNGDLGDLNDDGSLDVLDVVAMANLVLSGGDNEVADMNSDGLVNVLDVVILVNIILNN